MKLISAPVTFDYQYNNSISVHVSPTPASVEDDIADHLVKIFGTMITVTDDTVPVDPTVAPVTPVVDPATPADPAAPADPSSGGGLFGMFK